jgi:hypothetical protein
MLLRNGKVLKPAKRSNVEDDMNIIKELKIFFRSLLYYSLADIGNRLRIDEIERTKGRKATLDELIEWQPNQTFWSVNFCYFASKNLLSNKSFNDFLKFLKLLFLYHSKFWPLYMQMYVGLQLFCIVVFVYCSRYVCYECG